MYTRPVSTRQCGRWFKCVAFAVSSLCLVEAAAGQITVTDLGTLGGPSSEANAVNNFGEVVGGSQVASGEYRGFYWSAWTGMVDLGTLGGNSTTALDINDFGEVIGVSRTSAGQIHAFLWTPASGMVDLGSLGGDSQPVSINDFGDVSGFSATSGSWNRAFRWTSSEGMADLGTLGQRHTHGYALNNAGEVVGSSYVGSSFDAHGFFWSTGGGMIDLGTLGGASSSAIDINDNQEVVGNSTTSTGATHVFMWTQATGMIDLGTLGGNDSFVITNLLPTPHRLNAFGELTGVSSTASGQSRAFRWAPEEGMVDLGTLPNGTSSVGIAINNLGHVTGTGPQAFLWTGESGMVELTGLGGTSSNAAAIADSGFIAGAAVTAGGTRHATLWTYTIPTSTALTASPNPSAFGASVTLEATVSASAGTPSGTVEFFDGGNSLASASLVDGVALVTVSSFGAGTHQLIARYTGDTEFGPSESDSLDQVVVPAASATSIGVTPATSVFGQAITLSATVSSPAGTPSGVVEFLDGGTSIGTASLSSGTATLQTAGLAVGSHNLVARYAGSTNFASSASSARSHVVSKASTRTLLASSPNPSNVNQPVTLTATVTVQFPGAGMPAGTVTFFDGNTSLGTAALTQSGAAFRATLSTAAIKKGRRLLTAQYSGNVNFNSSTSPRYTHTVK